MMPMLRRFSSMVGGPRSQARRNSWRQGVQFRGRTRRPTSELTTDPETINAVSLRGECESAGPVVASLFAGAKTRDDLGGASEPGYTRSRKVSGGGYTARAPRSDPRDRSKGYSRPPAGSTTGRQDGGNKAIVYAAT